MANIEVDKKTADTIESLATAEGISTAEYVKRLLPSDPVSANGSSAERFLKDLDAIAVDAPSLPADFSRDDIYSDHD